MSFYEELVIETQRRNYSRYYSVYARGGTPFQLTDKPSLPYDEQIAAFAREVASADAVLVGGASGLSAAGGGDFYYADTASFRAHFGKFAEKYHFVGAFNGMRAPFQSRAEFWGYLATFLHTTQTAPLRTLQGSRCDPGGKRFPHPHDKPGHAVCQALSGKQSQRNPGRPPIFPVQPLLHR